MPPPTSGMSTTATVLSRLASISIGCLIFPVASACRSSCAIAARTGSARTSSALIATCAGALPPGKASISFLSGSTSAILMSSMPGLAVLMATAGSASVTSTAVEATAAPTGRRMTASSTGPQTRPRPSFEASRWRYGMRPFSTLSPSLASNAGSTVSEPIIATSTTIIVPTEKDMKVLSPERNIPAMAIITVMPEIRTARPDVAAAASSAARSLRPARRSSRSRRR